MMQRRFYGFNRPADVATIVAEIQTIEDLWQLEFDLAVSGTNLTYLIHSAPGVTVVDCVAENQIERYVFMTLEANERYGGLTEAELSKVKGFKVLSPTSESLLNHTKLIHSSLLN
ncbi:MAG: hypothetical protein LH702_07620 [Phormidesmis sp. CAN_BIN44]|nr:hypothetical protein [Phormidesmis sp. CAN_BIN44]